VKLRVPIPSTIKKLRSFYAPSEGREGKLRLDFNENTVGCSSEALAAIRRMTREQIAMYSEYETPKAKFARWLGVRPNELVLTNGADGAIQQIATTFLEKGSTVLLVEPTFVMYPFYIDLAGARTVRVRYGPEMEFPADKVMAALRKSPRAFFLANPNNPTGTLIERGLIGRMVQSAPRTLFIVDEAYYEFSHTTVARWIRRFPNLVVLRTFSKAAGLAGLRLGCVLACPEVIELMNKTRDPFPVNTTALVAGEACVRGHRAVAAYATEVNRAKEELAIALKNLGARVFPSAASFLLVDFERRGPRIVEALGRRGILLRDRTVDFGRPGFVRITIGTRPQMRRLMHEIRAIW
jgi:histidinol-phosphate aminotransferase